MLNFDGAEMSSDAGLTLLREVERRHDLAGLVASCLTDLREPGKVRHSLQGAAGAIAASAVPGMVKSPPSKSVTSTGTASKLRVIASPVAPPPLMSGCSTLSAVPSAICHRCNRGPNGQQGCAGEWAKLGGHAAALW